MASTGGIVSKFKTVQFDDDKISRFQDECERTISSLQSVPFLTGRAIQNVTLASGANSVNHGLGRKLVGWVATRRRGTGTIYDTQDSNALADRTLTLVASAAETVDLWVF